LLIASIVVAVAIIVLAGVGPFVLPDVADSTALGTPDASVTTASLASTGAVNMVSSVVGTVFVLLVAALFGLTVLRRRSNGANAREA
jgi:type II secretory pathway component PulF